MQVGFISAANVYRIVSLLLSSGVLNSHSRQTLRIDSVEHPITVDQTITFRECAHERPAVDSVRIAVSRNFFTYSGEENIVRYSQTNRVPGTGTLIRLFFILSLNLSLSLSLPSLK